MSRRCYSSHQQRIQQQLRTNPKSFWKYVNDQRKERGLPTSMTLDGEVATNVKEICRLFSIKFSGIFSNEALSSQQINLAASNVPMYGQTLSGLQIDDGRILAAISKLKKLTSVGPDGIPSIVLKNCAGELLTPLRQIFGMSLVTGSFPSLWK